MPQDTSATSHARRHSRWYEVLLFSVPCQLLAGLLCCVILPSLWLWDVSQWQHLTQNRVNTLWAAGSAWVLSFILLRRLSTFVGGHVWAHIAPVVSGVYALSFAVLFFTRSSYSRSALLVAWGLALLWCYSSYYIGRRYRRLKFAILPMADTTALQPAPNVEFRHLQAPDLQGIRYDGIVADLAGTSMTPEWERFLARCILAHIPVFNVRQVVEGLTGRVQIDHLSENEVGTLLPAPLYVISKRLIEMVLVIVSLPLVLPLMAVVALAIRLDSPGPALFVQNRVGLGNRDFRIFKFRSMVVDAEARGARLAGNDDDRITRVGRFIRKTRLDELPQLFNVLRGDMSLIGPRPEQRVFVDRFEEEIPFYIYRHVVRPGITGWAQVMQGYADDTESTRIKIQHDFYYIKHFSLWLDLLILFKTVRIVLTGWGAR
ncbi:sugar transferase [Castellaniella sp.]|uniref:sugar transferase n=1 Tax=Castellaniella sp. TaxID=1955812 RepID=UPI003565FB6C